VHDRGGGHELGKGGIERRRQGITGLERKDSVRRRGPTQCFGENERRVEVLAGGEEHPFGRPARDEVKGFWGRKKDRGGIFWGVTGKKNMVLGGGVRPLKKRMSLKKGGAQKLEGVRGKAFSTFKRSLKVLAQREGSGRSRGRKRR